MGKDKTEKKEKKEKKENKEKMSDDGVKKVKKDKKEKKLKERSPKEVDALLNAAETNGVKSDKKENNDAVGEDAPLKKMPKEALVPFANPLADDKQTRKVLKGVKKGSFAFPMSSDMR